MRVSVEGPQQHGLGNLQGSVPRDPRNIGSAIFQQGSVPRDNIGSAIFQVLVAAAAATIACYSYYYYSYYYYYHYYYYYYSYYYYYYYYVALGVPCKNL